MFGYLLAVLLLPALSLAQTPTFSNIAIHSKTYSSAVIRFTASVPTIENVIEYGPESGTDFPWSNVRRLASNSSHLNMTTGVTGLEASTTYRYRVCGKYQGVRGCSGVQTLTTAAKPPDRWLVNPPQVVPDPYPDMTGAVNLPVAANCSDLQAQIIKATQSVDATKYRIPVPPGIDCIVRASLYTRPASAGYILIEPDNSAMLHPPPGVRRDPARWPTNAMARLVLNSTQAGQAIFLLHSKGTNNVILRNVELTTGQPTASANNVGKAVTAIAPGNPAVFTVPSHGYTATAGSSSKQDPVILHVYGCTANPELDGSKAGQIGAITANTFTLAGISTGSANVAGCKVVRDPTGMSYFVSSAANTPNSGWIIDRCYLHNEFPFSVSSAISWGGLGTLAVVDSWISTMAWTTKNPKGGQMAYLTGVTVPSAIGMTYGKGILVRNNMIRTPGISIFAQEGAAGTEPSSDMTIEQNDFDWDLKYKMNDPASDGEIHTVRQPLEWKRGKRIAIVGNRIGNVWSTQVTGANVGVIVLTPRVVLGDVNTRNEISDVLIARNEVTTGPGFIQMTGGNTEDMPQTTAITARIRVLNNLVYGIDGVKWQADGGKSNGQAISLAGGYEDLAIEHNTFWDFFMRDSTASLFPVEGNRGTAIKIAGNTIGMNTSRPSTWGGTSLMKPQPANTTQFASIMKDKFRTAIIEGNVWVPGIAGAQASSDFNAAGITNCTDILAGSDATNTCVTGENANKRMANVEYHDAKRRNFLYKPTSKYARSLDGAEMGSVTDAVAAASGRPRFARVLNRKSGSAELRFLAASADSKCYVEYGPSADYGTGTRVEAPAGSTMRTVPMTGLSGQTHWRLMCAGAPVEGRF